MRHQTGCFSEAEHQHQQWRQGARQQTVLLWPWLVVAGAWLVALLATWTHQTYLLNHEYLIERSGLSWPAALVLFLSCWQVMTAAMMVPSSLPILQRAANSARAWLPSSQAVFLAGYASVWTGFAGVAFAGDTFIHWLVDHGTWLSMHTPVIGATTLALAGVYQLGPLKRSWLGACGHPFGDLPDDGRFGTGAAWRRGLRHGLCCLGNGWALMLVMFGAGMGSVAWMAALTGVMVVEKAVPGGKRIIPAVGVALLLLAVLWLLHPAWLALATDA